MNDAPLPPPPMPPGIMAIVRDPALEPRDLHVWLIALTHLDDVDFRELTLDMLMAEAGYSRAVVVACLRRLAGSGYLERAARGGSRGAAQYRVPVGQLRAPPAPAPPIVLPPGPARTASRVRSVIGGWLR